MKRACLRAALGALLLVGSVAHASGAPDPQPGRGPVPAWVRPMPIPAADAAHADLPIQVLLLEAQTRIDGKGVDTYFEMVMKPQNMAGLQGMSNIILPWNVSQSGMTIHAIEVLRGGKATDLIGTTAFTILRRESRLEEARLDGMRSVVLPARGIELGDVIRIAATYHTKPSEWMPKVDELSSWIASFYVAQTERRFVVAPGLPVKWRTGPLAPQPVITNGPAGTEYRFAGKAVEPLKFADNMPARDKDDSIQFSAYRDWSEVAAAHARLYQDARKLAPDSPLAAEAAKIAAATSDPHKRMLAALQLAQERVRYVAMLLGEGAFKPTGADETWEARFGDCKAKTALLLGLLDRLGIEANAMYVNARNGELLDQMLPALSVFDHVIVEAKIGGKAYYLDATDFGHRTTDDVAASVLGHGLPLVAGASLAKLPPYIASQPSVIVETVWDGSNGLKGEVPLKAVLTMRGPAAILARIKKAAAEKGSDFETFLKNSIPRVENKALTITRQQDDPATGAYVVEFSGKADMNWDEYEERKGVRFPFSNAATSWQIEFDRKEGKFKDAPVVLNPAYWQQEIETVVLPDDKGFRIDDASPLDRTVAGTRIWRTVTLSGNRVTSVANFRHVAPQISAAEARAAQAEIEKVSDNWAYLVGPRRLLAGKKPN